MFHSYYNLDTKSLKGLIIEILASEWPLTINEVFKTLKEECGRDISYQAVHKAIKQLQKDGCIEMNDHNYQISLSWVESLRTVLGQVLENYNYPNIKKTLHFTTLSIKDNRLREETRELKVKQVLRRLIPIYKQAFEKHNIFNKKTGDILNYLLDLQTKHEIRLFYVYGKLCGGTVVILGENDLRNKYVRWKLQHFACIRDLRLQDRLYILSNLEKSLKVKNKIIKIEYNMAETEKEYLTLFQKAGYARESAFMHRYRYGERSYTYTKTIEC